MLYFLVTKNHQYTLRWFLSDWGREIESRMRIVPYSDFLQRKRLPKGGYIFSDIERIKSRALASLQARHRALVDSGLCTAVLNQPEKVLKRYDLLRVLKDRGINTFDVYKINEDLRVTPGTFPVFVREANDHTGPYGGLIHDQASLDRALNQLALSGRLRGQPIVTEFVDTSDDDGVFRKFGAFRIGRRIIPTHVYFHTNWFVKASNSNLEDVMVQEEWDYVSQNPHESRLMDIFSIANIEYGRIDYSMFKGEIQVFEINTNPVVMREGTGKNPHRIERKKFVARRLMDAFLALGDSTA